MAKKETFIPKSPDQISNYMDWINSGRNNALKIAIEKAEDIIENYKIEALDEEKFEASENILSDVPPENIIAMFDEVNKIS